MKIPVYTPQTDFTPPPMDRTVDPGTAAAPFEAASRMGNALFDMGHKIDEQVMALDREREASDRMEKVKLDTADLQAALKADPKDPNAMANIRPEFAQYAAGGDWKAYEQNAKKAFDDVIRKNAMDGVKDGKLYNYLQKSVGAASGEFAIHIGAEGRKMAVNAYEGGLLRSLDTMGRLAIEAPTEQDRLNYVAQAQFQIRAAVSSGVWYEDKAYEVEKKWREHVAENRMKKAVDTDPDAFIRETLTGPGAYADLDYSKISAAKKSAVAHANETDKKRDRDFKEASGSVLNKALIAVNSGVLKRSDVEQYLVSTKTLTDEHERTLLHAVKTHEEEVRKADNQDERKSDVNRLEGWGIDIEMAYLRRDGKALREMAQSLSKDDLLVSKDRTPLLTKINGHLDTMKNQAIAAQGREDKVPPGWGQAQGILDKHFGFSPLTGSYFKLDKRAPHYDAMQELYNVSEGIRVDPSTGKTTRTQPKAGPALVNWAINYAKQKLAEENAPKPKAKAESYFPKPYTANPFELPSDNTWKQR